ncbi:MAG: hypothetical protein WCL71_16180 [Deltaproteobacteria bacterium]
MTIVLTHGWKNNSAVEWVTSMAATLNSFYGGKVNILAWDWESDANISSSNPVRSVDRAPAQGTALAQTLMNTLGPNYSQPIHFLGHSLGTLVNCVAADYIHADRRLTLGETRSANEKYDPLKTHVTLFDEAELAAPSNGLPVLLDILVGVYSLSNGQSNNAVKVIPSQAAYVDNYVSEVGLLHNAATNIMLWRRLAIPGINDIPGWGTGLHGYGCEWYRRTIQIPLTRSPGFYWSFERGSISTDPNSSIPKDNTFYIQNLDTNQSELSVSEVDAITAQLLSRKRLVVYPTLQAYRGLSAMGNAVQGVYLSGIQYAGSMVAKFAETISAPQGTPVYSGTAVSTPMYFLPAGQTASNDLQANWNLEFSIQPGSPQIQQFVAGRSLKAMGASSGTGPVYTIIPIHVPTEAVGLSFEYSITGAAVDDFMTMGIGTSNEYTMEAKFVDDGAWNGTPVIPVSQYRNKDIQLAFALNGASGTPTGTLGVRNIQFFIPPRPQLSLDMVGTGLTVSWPLSAIDWTLETTTNLSDPNSWQAEVGPPDDTEFSHSMTFDAPTTKRVFFRLKK